MLRIIKAEDRHFTDMGWLQSYWLFSFGDYYDPDNVAHGSLRVFNDETVQPRSGYPVHPHQEMEIVTLIMQGELTHKDNLGNEIILRAGDVHRLTAGTGLRHSEWNNGRHPAAVLQMWILPGERGLPPSCAQKHIEDSGRENRFALLAAGGAGESGPLPLNTDAFLFRGKMSAGRSEIYVAEPDRALFVYILSGGLTVNGQPAGARDQVRTGGEQRLEMAVPTSAEFILLDVPETVD